MKYLYLTIFSLLTFALSAQDETKLTGDYIWSSKSDTHEIADAFDGDSNTYFASKSEKGWVGYDFGEPCVITKLRYMRTSWKETNMKGGMIEGANSADFSDAIPLYWITDQPQMGAWNEVKVNISLGVRYVRYMGPLGDYSRIAELEFYGNKGVGDDKKMFSSMNIPIISIRCFDGIDPYDKENELTSIVTGIMPDGKNFIQDTATVRLRGNYSSSNECPKKSYRIKFDEKRKFFGSPAKVKKWTLIPNYGDKTLIRNQLALDISERFGMPYTPFHQMVHVFLNAEYKGVYQLCDQVEINKNKINIDEMEEGDVEGEALTGGYFLEIDAYAKDEDWYFMSNKNIPVTIKSPEKSDDAAVVAEQVEKQQKYIVDYFNQMEELVFIKNYDVEEGYQKYLDLPSFLKRHLHQELVGNTDALWSCFMYKPRGVGSKLMTGPVWDHDLAFDNDKRIHTYLSNTNNMGWSYNYGSSYGRSAPSSAGSTNTQKFWDYILADPIAEHKMWAEWARLRCTKAVDLDELYSVIDGYYYMLGGVAQDMNFTRWDILNSQVHQNYIARGSYQAEVDYLKTYLGFRIPWMDNKLNCKEDTYELTISDAKWATLYIPFAAEIPNGLKVYIVTGTEGNKLVKEEVDLIEAYTPYLVNGERGTYAIKGYSVKDDWDKQTMGLLTGTIFTGKVPEESYVMQQIEGVVCFRKVIPDDLPTITPHKCYLFPPYFKVEAPERLQIDDEETNDLDFIESESHNGILRVYGLNGALVYDGSTGDPNVDNVLNTLPKGVYVVTMDGKEYKKIVRK
ncbi:MAG: CotH kinase family protein [Bacteroidales bacterium]|nr:CotH kinase family protein [Bacteroidales bacterium]